MNSISPLHPTQEEEILELLEVIRISGVKATRLLEGENHEALMAAFERVYSRISRIIEKKHEASLRKRNIPTKTLSTLGSHEANRGQIGIQISRGEKSLSSPEKDISSEDMQVSREEQYLALYTRLFQRQKDPRRFFRDLLAFSQDESDFPRTIDGWILYLDLWDKTIALLSDLLKQKGEQGGDIGIIAKFILTDIFPHIISRHEYLSEHEMTLSIDSERTLRFRSLYDVFYYLGEGGASQIISPILHALRKRGGSISTFEPSKKRRSHRQRGIFLRSSTVISPPEPERVALTPGVIVHENRISSLPPSDNLIGAISDITARTMVEFHSRDLVETAFGSITLSASVTDSIKIRAFSSLFPSGYYNKENTGIFVTNSTH